MASPINPDVLTPAQLDGIACVWCGNEAAPMVPVGILGGRQLFACCTSRAGH